MRLPRLPYCVTGSGVRAVIKCCSLAYGGVDTRCGQLGSCARRHRVIRRHEACETTVRSVRLPRGHRCSLWRTEPGSVLCRGAAIRQQSCRSAHRRRFTTRRCCSDWKPDAKSVEVGRLVGMIALSAFFRIRGLRVSAVAVVATHRSSRSKRHAHRRSSPRALNPQEQTHALAHWQAPVSSSDRPTMPSRRCSTSPFSGAIPSHHSTTPTTRRAKVANAHATKTERAPNTRCRVAGQRFRAECGSCNGQARVRG